MFIVLWFFWIFLKQRESITTPSAEIKNPVEQILPEVECEAPEKNIFNIFKSLDLTQVSCFLHSERPQTIAFILSHLEPTQAAQWIAVLPAEQQSEVVARIGTMNKIDPNIAVSVAALLQKRLALAASHPLKSVGGAKSVAKILSFVDHAMRKKIINEIEITHPSLTEEIKGFRGAGEASRE